MHSVEKSAKTLDEAVRLALYELDCSEEQVNIEVLEEPGKRLFGFLGAKEARVRVTKKKPPAGSPPQMPGRPVKRWNFLRKMLGKPPLTLRKVRRKKNC